MNCMMRCMCVHIHTYTHIYIYTHMCIYIYIYIYIIYLGSNAVASEDFERELQTLRVRWDHVMCLVFCTSAVQRILRADVFWVC